MTDAEIAALKAAAEASIADCPEGEVAWYAPHRPGFDGPITPSPADAAFIAAASPSAVLALLAERERLREALRAHDAYMAERYEGPESDALHPAAAENWRRVRAALEPRA